MIEQKLISVESLQDKNYVNKVLENRVKVLQSELKRVKDHRKALEEKKDFWKNREEQFRTECFKIKQQSTHTPNHQKNNAEISIKQQQINRKTNKAILQAEKLFQRQLNQYFSRQKNLI